MPARGINAGLSSGQQPDGIAIGGQHPGSYAAKAHAARNQVIALAPHPKRRESDRPMLNRPARRM